MSRYQKSLFHLEALPRYVISHILSEVANVNREDVTNCILTCDELAKSANDMMEEHGAQQIGYMTLLVVKNYTNLMAKCIQHSNPSAHYLRGILEYFCNEQPTKGLVHIFNDVSATNPIPEVAYLYGMINFCMGQFEVGKHYVDQYRSSDETFEADKFWGNIKQSLHGIGITWKLEYMVSFREIVPLFECNLNDMENTCDHCFHYKHMTSFIYTI